jgi:hypothetical protein
MASAVSAKSRTMNHHRLWPRQCEAPTDVLPSSYLRIVRTMRLRAQAHLAEGLDPLSIGLGSTDQFTVGRFSIRRLAFVQACLYATLDAWSRLARDENIRWAACDSALFGAMCYGAMPAWVERIAVSVPQQDCKALDRIWNQANVSYEQPNDFMGRWVPRRLEHLGLSIWKSSVGEAASTGHRKFSIWNHDAAEEDGSPRRSGAVLQHERQKVTTSWASSPQNSVLGLDVMCAQQHMKVSRAGAKRIGAILNYTRAVSQSRVSPVEFGPTTILQVPKYIAVEYIRARGWDTTCRAIPPMSARAKEALERTRFKARAEVQRLALKAKRAKARRIGATVTGSERKSRIKRKTNQARAASATRNRKARLKALGNAHLLYNMYGPYEYEGINVQGS